VRSRTSFITFHVVEEYLSRHGRITSLRAVVQRIEPTVSPK
jgi:hypothetical protein